MDVYYKDDWVTIYNGDCREVMDGLGGVDLVLTDPPYGINVCDAKRQKSRDNLAIAGDYGENEWDKSPVDFNVLQSLLSLGRFKISFGGNYYQFPPSRGWLVWDKDNTGDFADCELAYTNLPQSVRKIKYRWNGMLQEPGYPHEKRVHPTQKPLQVIKWCIFQAQKHGLIDTILDPFMGSGTTLRAAKDLNKRAIGIEIEEKYCEIAAERCCQEVLNLSVVDEG